MDVVFNKLVVEEQYSHIAFIKVDANLVKNEEFLQQYKIRFVPTLYTYNASGEEVWNYIGPLDEAAFREKLDAIK
ncbi:thioredoxin domain-containing protein [Desulfuribacillus stibiiarsenatis]|uniref:thioredoxin domain-containing protein n=1 Tax=Desulfuribacillus stibiiarsenatis TaxID=1390249 RepID=UPI0009F2375B